MRNLRIGILTDRLGQFEEVGAVIGQVIGQLNLGQFFGGRSPQQIAQDEANSIASNQNGFKVQFNCDLSAAQVAAILTPGWAMQENGTQLWNRMVQYHQLYGCKDNYSNSSGGLSLNTTGFDLGTLLTVGLVAGGIYYVVKQKR
jgi:hypothetical protein